MKIPEKLTVSDTKLKPGISVVCAVKNRSLPLRYSIPSWLSHPNVCQLILVDWCSDVPVHLQLKEADIPGWPDSRVSVVRIEQQPVWNLARAYNLGLRFVVGECIFKADADIVMVGDIVERKPTPGETFLAGNWANARNRNETFLNGSLLIATNDMLSVGGYDERVDRYGWDDDDLYQRLRNRNLRRIGFKHGVLFHLPHSDRSRIAHQTTVSNNPKESVQVQRILAEHRKPWSATSVGMNYRIIGFEGGQQLVRVKEIQ